MQYDLNKLQDGLEKLDISLSDLQVKQLLTFYEVLKEKNKVLNLTAITDFDEEIGRAHV